MVDPLTPRPGGDALPAPLVLTLPPTPLVELLDRLHDLPSPVLLDSAGVDHPLSRWSFLSADPLLVVEGDAPDWPRLVEALRRPLHHPVPVAPDQPPFRGGWIGWMSYEFGAAFDRMPSAPRREPALPGTRWGLYDWVIAQDHQTGRTLLISTGIDADGTPDPARAAARSAQVTRWLARPLPPMQPLDGPSPAVSAATPVPRFADAGPPVLTDLPAQVYQEQVAQIIAAIRRGDLFQANLTQRFVMPWTDSPLAWARAVRRFAPAPMAACLGGSNAWIVSASPERFLRYDAVRRTVETRPIKGTRPRGLSPDADLALREDLRTSAKDHAENVMIVDLLRNDLARVCEPGSVAVPDLCRMESHATVHHLVSVVTGRLTADADVFDLLAATLPGGSITGAPKIAATALLAELETVTREIYCGIIGWIGLDGSLDSAIAIRTTTIHPGVIVANAGGGITAQSDPAAEYEESLDKVAALVAAWRWAREQSAP